MYPDGRKKYLLTYSMEQSPSWEANRYAASQQIPYVYGTRRFKPQAQVPATCPHPEPQQSSPRPHIPVTEDPS